MREGLVSVARHWTERVGLVEVVGWTPDGLERIFAASGLDLPRDAGQVATKGSACVARVTPSAAWVLGDDARALVQEIPEDGAIVDLSNSRVRIEIKGTGALDTLRTLVGVDLRDMAGVCWTGIHGVPVMVLRTGVADFDVLVPRSFFETIGELIEDAAKSG